MAKAFSSKIILFWGVISLLIPLALLCVAFLLPLGPFVLCAFVLGELISLICLGFSIKNYIGKYELLIESKNKDIQALDQMYRTKLSEQDQKHQEDINLFIRDIAHQIRMPLAIIQGYSNLLANDMVSEETARHDYLLKISDKTNFLCTVVSNQFSSNSEHYVPIPVFRELDIIALLKGSCLDLTSVSSAKGIEIQFLSTADSYNLMGDFVLLNKIAFNIIENAIKYMNRNGLLMIYTEICDGGINITFKDDGMGLAANECSSIFQAKFQGSNKTKGSGSGLGLYFVKKAVEAHHGTIEAKSDIGRGMTMKIFLPQKQN